MKTSSLMLSVLLGTLCIAGLTLPALAVVTATLDTDPDYVTTTVSSKFDVKVWIRSLTGPMIRFSLSITWDPTQLEYVRHENYVASRGWDVDEERVAPFGNLMQYLLLASGSEYSADAQWVSITFHCLGKGSSTISVNGWVCDTENDQDKRFPETIAIPVSQVLPSPVGGVSMPVNKLNVVAPYFALIGLIATVSASIIVRKRRRV